MTEHSLTVLVALATCAAPALVRADNASITVVGNRAITSAKLAPILVDALGRDAPPFDPQLVDRASLILSRTYWDRGYAAVRVEDPTIDPDSGTLTFTVTEGPRFKLNDVRVEGELLGTAADNRAHLHVASGTVFSRTKIANDREALARFYQGAGYAFVEVEPFTRVDTDHATIDLVFHITRGVRARFGRILFDGRDSSTLPADLSIRKALTISPGAPYSVAALTESQQHLQDLGYRVEIATKTGSASDLVDVELDLHAR